MIVETFVVGPLETNCFLVQCEKTAEAIVIDPGDLSGSLKRAITKAGRKIVAVVNTHGHVDHVSGNKAVMEWTKAPLLIHKEDAALLAQSVEQGLLFGLKADPSPPPDRFVRDHDTIACGDLSLTVLHTPGHTPGSISLLCEEALFVGDLIFRESVGRTDLPGGSYQQLLNSIETKVFALPESTRVYSGHGPATTVGHEMSHNPFVGRQHKL